MTESTETLPSKMYELRSDELSKRLSMKLYEQKELGYLCDVILSHNDANIWAHSCILSSFSPFFLRYFITVNQKSIKDKLSNYPYKLSVTDITKCQNFSKNNCMFCISSIINYLYTGEIKISSDHIDHVTNMSCNLEIEELISFCRQFCKLSILFMASNCENDEKNESISSRESNTACNEEKTSSRQEEDKLIFDIVQKDIQADKNISNLHHSQTNLKVKTSDSNKLSLCHECDKSFTSPDVLKQHNLVHHSKLFNCLYCDFKSYKLLLMMKHLTEVNNHNNILCSICLYSGENIDDIRKHFSEHQLDMPFSCKVCKTRFKTKIYWSRHLLSHSISSSFKCPACDMFFKNRASLKMHILSIHRSKTRNCDICNYSTRYPALLERHKLKHNGQFLSCNSPGCNFQTYRKDMLKTHSKIHGNKLGFVCKICGRTFSFNRNLKRHMNSHDSTMTVLKCTECDYENKRFDKMKDHCLNMHRENATILEEIAKQCVNRIPSSGGNIIIDRDNDGISNFDLSSKPLNDDKNTAFSVNMSQSKTTEQNSNTYVQYLNESTGELTFLCNEMGEPLAGNLYSLHNLNEDNCDKSKVLCVEPVTDRVQEVVILNEATGELLSVSTNTNEEPITLESDSKGPASIVTLLNETTGEIMSTQSPILEDQGSVTQIFDNIFDSVDFDAMNDDSFDGFDGFDDFLFETNATVGKNNSVMDKILNEVTGELFPGEVSSPQDEGAPFWKMVPSLNEEYMSSKNDPVFSEIFLNEVTGEISLAN